MMVLFALGFTVLAAGVGMGADMGLWLVERQHLQTAVDSAAIAGARYYVAYSGASDQATQAQTQAQNYLTQYGYPASSFSGSGESLTFTSLPPRQFKITATKVRQTMLLQLVGVRTLSATATSTANGEIKADIYVALDTTPSMSSSDITAMKTAVNTFVGLLGLDPTDASGPQVAIGRFMGERCWRKNSGGYNLVDSHGSTRVDASQTTYMIGFLNYQPTTSGWCDNNDTKPNLSASTIPSATAFVPANSAATPTGWNPHYPGSVTKQTLTKTASQATSAVSSIDTGIDSSCSTTFTPYSALSLTQYGGCDLYAATSHTAGLTTAYRELTSTRARGVPFRRVLILQTDGTVCTMQTAYTQIAPSASAVPTYVPSGVLPQHGNSSATRSENKALDMANYMKTTPSAFEGIEIFTILFWKNDGTNTCYDNTVYDTDTSLSPACGPDTMTLPAASTRTHVDDYMIGMSSSTPNTCDHYLPADKNNPSSLTDAYRKILVRLAVGKIVS